MPSPLPCAPCSPGSSSVSVKCVVALRTPSGCRSASRLPASHARPAAASSRTCGLARSGAAAETSAAAGTSTVSVSGAVISYARIGTSPGLKASAASAPPAPSVTVGGSDSTSVCSSSSSTERLPVPQLATLTFSGGVSAASMRRFHPRRSCCADATPRSSWRCSELLCRSSGAKESATSDTSSCVPASRGGSPRRVPLRASSEPPSRAAPLSGTTTNDATPRSGR